MSIELEKGLVSVLAAVSPTIQAYSRLPQPPSFPAVRYQRVYTTRTNAIDATNVGVTEAGIQIDCIASSSADAWGMADRVRSALHGYRGSWGTLIARFVHLQTENSFYEQDGDKVTHWVTQRYQVWTDMN